MSSEREIFLEVWPINNNKLAPAELFPEQIEKVVEVNDGSVGIAASGGGSRSHALCAGYYRALSNLNYMGDVDYISSVSGGSWASSAYVFAQGKNQQNDRDQKYENLNSLTEEEKQEREAINRDQEEELLGTHTEPSLLTLKFLKSHSSGTLSEVIHKNFVWQGLLDLAKRAASSKDIWPYLVGRLLLEPFDLENKIFLQSHHFIKKFLSKNTIENIDSIVLPRDNKPFLIINASLAGPRHKSTGWGESLQISSMYAGIPFFSNDSFSSFHYKIDTWKNIGQVAHSKNMSQSEYLQKLHDRDFKIIDDDFEPKPEKMYAGGGVISSYAFGAKKLSNPDYYRGTQNGELVSGITEYQFHLQDAVAASSLAYTDALQNELPAVKLFPFVNYFSVLNKEQDQSNPEFQLNLNNQRGLADGGIYEDTGILTLVQRGIKNIISLINTDHVFRRYNKDDKGEAILPKDTKGENMNLIDIGDYFYDIDPELTVLFGYFTKMTLFFNWNQNQIFSRDAFPAVVEGLYNSINEEKRGGVFYQELTTIENNYWSIRADQNLRVLFVINEKCETFIEQLPKETRSKIGSKKIIDKFNTLRKFPYFNTFIANAKPVSLDKSQTNIMVAQADFVLRMERNVSDLDKIFERKRKN